MTTEIKCLACGRERDAYNNPEDMHNYSPASIIIDGQPSGWYSGDDGEICQRCFRDLFYNQ